MRMLSSRVAAQRAVTYRCRSSSTRHLYPRSSAKKGADSGGLHWSLSFAPFFAGGPPVGYADPWSCASFPGRRSRSVAEEGSPP